MRRFSCRIVVSAFGSFSTWFIYKNNHSNKYVFLIFPPTTKHVPNPFVRVAGKAHGAVLDEQRMVGDLGNISADEQGVAVVNISDPIIQLVGPHSIIGRSVVVYAGEDDQGRGGHEHSLTTGNSGPRIAAGVIGLAL
jgi:Copper/zinc superoxide dismutase (SODC)